MFRLKTKTPPGAWVELAAGVELYMREADGAEQALAEQNARAKVRAMIEADDVAEDFALGGYDFSELLSEKEPTIFAGFGQLIFAVELAMIVASDIRGLAFDDSETPAPFERSTLARLFRAALPEPVEVTGLSVRRFSTIFLDKALKAPMMRQEEGNVSGAARSGTGAAAPRNAEPAGS